MKRVARIDYLNRMDIEVDIHQIDSQDNASAKGMIMLCG